ncbi:hypothetical protein ACQ4LE_009728 [Meloidogyne hapla]
MFSRKISFIIFLLRVLIPICTLTVEEGVKIKELPEYSEYLRQLGDRQIISTTTEEVQRKSAVGPFSNFPSIQLCKDAPATSENTHVYCWVMLLLYTLLVLSLIIYQLRSIVWLGTTIPKRKEKKESKNIELGLIDEQSTDYKNIIDKSKDEYSVPRVLTV